MDYGDAVSCSDFGVCRLRFNVESSETICSAVGIFKIICAALGAQLEPSKEQPRSAKFVLLGAEISTEMDHVTATLPDRKRKDFANEIRQVSEKCPLTLPTPGRLEAALDFHNPYFSVELAGPSSPLSHADNIRN